MIVNSNLCFVFCFLIFSLQLSAQVDRELAMVQTIEHLNSNVVKAKDGVNLAPSVFNRYQKIIKEHSDDQHLSAVANALIGNDLRKKGYHTTAVNFLKAAYALRKKEGDYMPQRWALNALVQNSIKVADFKSTFKYSKAFLKLTDKIVGSKSALTGVVYDKYEFLQTFELLLYRIHPDRPYYLAVDENRRAKRVWRENMKERGDCAHKLIKYCLKKYPDYKSNISEIAEESFYSPKISNELNASRTDSINYWISKSKKILKKRLDPKPYTDFIRMTAAKCRKKEKGEWGGLKTADYEMLGIELIEDYINACKKIKRNDQVLFGYRYIATRYRALGEYKKATQYLATAIKYCHEYNMPDEIVKSIGGMESMLYFVRKQVGKVGVREAMAWKENYSLKGLTAKDISEFDEIIKYHFEY